MKFLILLFGLIATAAYSDTTEMPGSLRIEVLPGEFADLVWDDNKATLSGPVGESVEFYADDLGSHLPTYPIIRHDIDRDGVEEIGVPTDYVYGGVNVVYTFFFWRGDAWEYVANLSDPSFHEDHPGLTTGATVGMSWLAERWDVGPDGKLFLHSSHRPSFLDFIIRSVTEYGTDTPIVTVVSEDTGLFDPAEPVMGAVLDDGLSLWSDPEGKQTIAKLSAETEFVLQDYDPQTGYVYVRAADGRSGWADPTQFYVLE